jgi:ribonuclease-3
MRSRFRSESGAPVRSAGRSLELVRVRGAQRRSGAEGGDLKKRPRRRGGRGNRGRGGPSRPPGPPKRFSFWAWLRGLFGPGAPAQAPARREGTLGDQEGKVIAAFQQHYGLTFSNRSLLKLALTHRSYLSVTGQGPRESNERLEFLGDSVLGLVTSEYLYRENPTEHEGQLTKTKSLLVSKAILSRRALAMGLGRFVLMSHSEVESGGRQRLSIIADAFESVVGAIYLDQGFEAARGFIHRWLLRDSGEIVADKRHTNYKSHLQEYVQSTFHTHPVYRIRGELGPDHSKHFQVEVMVGKRVLGEGRGRNKKEAEQAAARDALEKVETGESGRRAERRRREPEAAAAAPASVPVSAPIERAERPSARPESREPAPVTPAIPVASDTATEFTPRTRRGGRRARPGAAPVAAPPESPTLAPPRPQVTADERDAVEIVYRPPSLARIALPEDHEPVVTRAPEVEPPPPSYLEDDVEEIGRPEGPLEERHIDPYGFEPLPGPEVGPEAWVETRVSGRGRAAISTRSEEGAPIEIPGSLEEALDEPELEMESPGVGDEAAAGVEDIEEPLDSGRAGLDENDRTARPERETGEEARPSYGRRGKKRR